MVSLAAVLLGSWNSSDVRNKRPAAPQRKVRLRTFHGGGVGPEGGMTPGVRGWKALIFDAQSGYEEKSKGMCPWSWADPRLGEAIRTQTRRTGKGWL